MATAITVLNASAQRMSARAIENVHLAYYEKDGIRDNVTAIETKLRSVGQNVFALARHAAKVHPKLEDAEVMFLAMCEYAEQGYKTEHRVENLREALPTWATLKSNVLRGLRAGLNPLEHRTEKIFRSRTMEQVSRAQTRPRPGQARITGPPTKPLEPEAITEVLAETAVPDSLKQLVAQVVYAVEVVNVRKIEQAEEVLREAWQKLGALTDQRKIR